MKIKIFLSIAVVSSPLFSMDEWSGLVPSWGEGPIKELSPEQQRTAWHDVTRHWLREPRDTCWYHRMFQPHKEALEHAKHAYAEAGIHGYVPLRTTYEGLWREDEGRLSHGLSLACANSRAIWLGPKALKQLISDDPTERALAEKTLLHEHEHWAKKHTSLWRLLSGSWRRDEYEADLAAYRGLSTAKLMRLKKWFSTEEFPGSSKNHPHPAESLMMINEELEQRARGKRERGSYAQSPSWKSFSARK